MCMYNEKAMRPRRGEGEKQDGQKTRKEDASSTKEGMEAINNKVIRTPMADGLELKLS